MPTPNIIKYSTAPDTKAIKVGNFSLGVSAAEYGPTNSTDYWNGISPASGGYTVYENKASGGPSIRTFPDSTEVVKFVNAGYGQSFSTGSPELAFSYINGLGTTIVVEKDHPEITTNGLKLHLDSNFIPSYPQTGVSWKDLSFSGNNCTLVNGPAWTSASGGGFTFDGSNDYASAGSNSSLEITGNVTVAAWVRPSLFTNQGNIFAKNGNAGYRARFQSDGSFWLYANGNQVTSSTLYSANAWYHTVSAFTSAGLRMYINGGLVNSNSTAFSPNFASASNFYVGSLNSTLELFQGKIATLSVYNRALSATEVLNDYNNQKTRFGL